MKRYYNEEQAGQGGRFIHFISSPGNTALLGINSFNINAVDNNGYTALHIAAAKDDIPTVKALIALGAAFTRDNEGNTPLHLAAENNHGDCIDLLWQGSYMWHTWMMDRTEVANNDGYTALHIAAGNGNRYALKRLLINNQSIIIYPALPHCYLPLHCAAESGHTTIVEDLLVWGKPHGLTVDFKVVFKEDTSLHLAARNGHIETVKFLLSKGANPNLLNSDKLTPLHEAEHNKHQEVCALLREAMLTLSVNAPVTVADVESANTAAAALSLSSNRSILTSQKMESFDRHISNDSNEPANPSNERSLYSKFVSCFK